MLRQRSADPRPCSVGFVAGAGFEPATYHLGAERSEARRRPHFEAEQDSKKADMSVGL